VFIPALLKGFGWSRTKVSLLPSVAALAWGGFVFPVGWLLDWAEARLIMITGALAVAVGFLVAGREQSFTPLFIAYLMLGVGIAAGTIAPAAFVVANWFSARRGTRDGGHARRNDHGRDADDIGGESYDRSLGMAGSVSGLLGAGVPNRNSRSAADGAQPSAWYAADVGRGSGRELGGIRNCCGIADALAVDDRAGPIPVGVCDYRLHHSFDSIFNR